MSALKLLLLFLVIRVSIAVRTDQSCAQEAGSVSCRIGTVNDENLARLPWNCTTLVGDLVLQDMQVLPSKMDMLANVTYVKGGIKIRRTQFSDNFAFLNNLRCIENDSGPAIILEENSNLYTLGLENIEYISGDGDPVLLTIADSYLSLVEESELKKLVSVSSSDGSYHDDMIEVMEIRGDFEVFYFVVTFSITCIVVAAFIVVAHFALKLHIPKGCDVKCGAAHSPHSSKRSTATESQTSKKPHTRHICSVSQQSKRP